MSASPPVGCHSQTSLSPSNSQHPPFTTDDIPIDTLVTHLLSAKRALSSINTVWRANEIVTSARSALEESVILNSRTSFLRKGISQQTKLLKRVRRGIEAVYKDGIDEFEDVLHNLDEADSRLQRTMDVLRSTIVESAFRPEDEEPRSLLDFVDEAGVETMRTALKESIDQSQEAQADFLHTIQSYDTDLKSIRSALSSHSYATGATTNPSHISTLLQTLESHASEMASLLSSLVAHYDLCVTAIRHTEGGLTAVRDATLTNPNLPSLSGVIGSPANSTAHLEPISADERTEMLTVLSNDAAEVDDVISEFGERLASMEATLSSITEHLETVGSIYKSHVHGFKLLDAVGTKLPLYISSSGTFLAKQSDIKIQIAAQMEDLDSMRNFYEGYLSSYDGLILEVERRRKAEEKMKNVVRKAMDSVKKLHDLDSREREGFRNDVGDFLPGDLWPGLRMDAKRWVVRVDDEGESEEGEGVVAVGASTPVLGERIVEAAKDREARRSGK